MTESTKGIIPRWVHIIFVIPIVAYIYSPFQDLANYSPVVQYIARSADTARN